MAPFNAGLGAFAPVQSTNDDDGQVDTVFRFNGNGLSPFTAVNDSINNTPLYYMELNSNVNGNTISGNTLKTLGASAGTAPAEQYNGFSKPGIVQNGSGTVNISAPVFNRDSLVLSGNGTGLVNLSGTQTQQFVAGDANNVKNIYKSGSSSFVITGNATAYKFDSGTALGFVEVDGGTLGINSTLGAAGANAVNANIGQNGTAGTLRGVGTVTGNLVVGASGTVFPGDITIPNAVTLTDTANTLTNGTLGNLTVGNADLSAGGTLYVRVFSPHPGSISSDKLTVLSGTITLINASKLNIHVQAGGNYSTPNDTLIADMQVLGNLFNSTPFQSVSVTSMTAGGQAGNIGTNLQVLYVNSSIFTPNTAGTNGVVGVYTNGDAGPPALSGSFDRIYVRLSGNVTPATVDSFAAKAEGAGVTVDWHVSSEYMNLGYDLYRRAVGSTAWTKINSTLIPGRMTNPSSRNYRITD